MTYPDTVTQACGTHSHMDKDRKTMAEGHTRTEANTDAPSQKQRPSYKQLNRQTDRKTYTHLDTFLHVKVINRKRSSSFRVQLVNS